MSLILNTQPLVVIPELAVRLGLNEAIVLQQLHYWISKTTSGIEFDGKRWVYNSYEQWVEQFPFWSSDTIKRTLTSLKTKGVISVEQLNKSKCDRTNYYAINYSHESLIDSGSLHRSIGANCTDRQVQNTLISTENTTETTTIIESETHQQQPADKTKNNYDKIVDAYHEILPAMPAVREITASRKTKIKNFMSKYRFNLTDWEGYLNYIAANCTWMFERRPRGRDGETFWKAKNLDFLLTEKCYLGVREGRYDDNN